MCGQIVWCPACKQMDASDGHFDPYCFQTDIRPMCLNDNLVRKVYYFWFVRQYSARFLTCWQCGWRNGDNYCLVSPPLWFTLKSLQLLDGLEWNLLQTFVISREWSHLFLMIPWPILMCHHVVNFLVFNKISQWPLDGFSWNVVQTFMFPSWWILKL